MTSAMNLLTQLGEQLGALMSGQDTGAKGKGAPPDEAAMAGFGTVLAQSLQDVLPQKGPAAPETPVVDVPLAEVLPDDPALPIDGEPVPEAEGETATPANPSVARSLLREGGVLHLLLTRGIASPQAIEHVPANPVTGGEQPTAKQPVPTPDQQAVTDAQTAVTDSVDGPVLPTGTDAPGTTSGKTDATAAADTVIANAPASKADILSTDPAHLSSASSSPEAGDQSEPGALKPAKKNAPDLPVQGTGKPAPVDSETTALPEPSPELSGAPVSDTPVLSGESDNAGIPSAESQTTTSPLETADTPDTETSPAQTKPGLTQAAAVHQALAAKLPEAARADEWAPPSQGVRPVADTLEKPSLPPQASQRAQELHAQAPQNSSPPAPSELPEPVNTQQPLSTAGIPASPAKPVESNLGFQSTLAAFSDEAPSTPETSPRVDQPLTEAVDLPEAPKSEVKANAFSTLVSNEPSVKNHQPAPQVFRNPILEKLSANDLSQAEVSIEVVAPAEAAAATVEVSAPSTPAPDSSSEPTLTPISPAVGKAPSFSASSASQSPQHSVFQSSAENVSDQVVEGATYAARAGQKSVVIKLNPDNLGEVRINLTSDATRQVSARLIATTAEAREQLQSQLDSLKQSLESQGVKVDRLQVLLAGSDNNLRDSGQQQSSAQQQQHQFSQNTASDDTRHQQFNQHEQAARQFQPGGQQGGFNKHAYASLGGGNTAQPISGEPGGGGSESGGPQRHENGQISILA